METEQRNVHSLLKVFFQVLCFVRTNLSDEIQTSGFQLQAAAVHTELRGVRGECVGGGNGKHIVMCVCVCVTRKCGHANILILH